MKKYKNFIKKTIVIFLGIFFALFISEIFLRLFINKSNLNNIKIAFDFKKNEFVQWAYLDIRKNFFHIQDDQFYIQRYDLWKPSNDQEYYPINKIKNKKRIFIVGESTARNFNKNILYDFVSKYFDVEIINSGMGGYDSYRIEKITKEIKNFKPDWVILLIGNNDGINNYFCSPKIEPVDINILSYKYSIFNKIRTLNLLSNLITPAIILDKDNVEDNFKNNVRKIIKNLKNTKIIFCDLPNNEQYQVGDIFESIKQRISLKIYNNSLWKNTLDYKALFLRMNFLKELSNKYDNLFITNLTDIIKMFTGGKIDYNVFIDNYHFTDATYILLSEIITKIIVKEDLKLNIDVKLTKDNYLNLLKNNRVEIPSYYISMYYSLSFEMLKLDVKYNYDKVLIKYKKIFDSFKINKKYDDYLFLVLYADVLCYNNEVKKSKEILNYLISLSPKNFEAYLIIGYIYYKENNLKKADEYFNIVKKINKDSKINVSFLNSIRDNLI